jgi:hypothetical protein
MPTGACKKGGSSESRLEVNWLPDLDLSAFSSTVTNYGKNKPPSQLQVPRAADEMESRPLKKFQGAKEHVEIFDKADEYLQTYGDNSRRKAAKIHRDWEDRWVKPFHETMM